MSHITDARASVNKVVSLLVSRFGNQEEVFGHLTDALRHIGEVEATLEKAADAPQVHPEQPVETVSDPATETTTTNAEVDAVTPEAESEAAKPAAPPKARKARKANR